jgi:glycosyltransferase involved in cell wall biosynthesis
MITVVMPAYNASKFIDLSIQSILNQTFSEFEFIIIDDGSTDDTLKKVEIYSQQDNRIKLIKTDHIGVSRARNLGIKEAKFPWIAMMDADDISQPQRLEKQILAAQSNPKVIIWGTHAYQINLEGVILSFVQQRPTSEEEFYRLYQQREIPFFLNSTGMFNKEVLLKVGGYTTEFDIGTDFELFAKMSHYGPFVVIDEPLYLYRLHLQSESMQNFFSQRVSIRYVCTKYRYYLDENKLITYDEFLEEYKNKPLLLRSKRYLHTLGQYYFRKSGLFFGNKNYLNFLFYLLLAILINPSFSLDNIWKKRLSPRARQQINNLK